MIELIKHCQNYNRIDLFFFAKEYEEVIECQETDVSPTFLGLSNPYLLPEKFIYIKNLIPNMLHFGKMRRPELESSY